MTEWMADVEKPEEVVGTKEGLTLAEGLKSTTFKVTVKGWTSPEGDIMDVNGFFHLVWDSVGDLVEIHFDGLNPQAANAKAIIREYCRELSERLSTRAIGLLYICDRWVGQRFEPSGYCPQAHGMVTSILDAASRVFRKRYNLMED